jgi:D-sedoheptulose 7-phosphate isomerase
VTSSIIAAHFGHSLAALQQATQDEVLLGALKAIADAITDALKSGHKLLIAGNGGSAADAQHIAAELVGRYKSERSPLPAIALTTDTSALTAIGNDYGFARIFERQVQALGQKGDVLLAISTSGRSENILAAIHAAKARGLIVIGFTGASGGDMRALCDHILLSPGKDTATIQQIHMVAAHAICDAVEQSLSSKPDAKS